MQMQTLVVQGEDFHPEVQVSATHAKLIIQQDGSIEVTLGKLNRAGHYQPNRKLRKTVTAPGMSRVVHDGAGWNMRSVRSFVVGVVLVNWEPRK